MPVNPKTMWSLYFQTKICFFSAQIKVLSFLDVHDDSIKFT